MWKLFFHIYSHLYIFSIINNSFAVCTIECSGYKINMQFQNRNNFINCFLKLMGNEADRNLAFCKNCLRACFLKHFLKAKLLNTGTLKGNAEHLVSQPEMGLHYNYWLMVQHSKHLLCFCCQHLLRLFLVWIHYLDLEYYPLSAFSPCCCGLSLIPSSKVDTWFGPKPMRISLSPTHAIGSGTSMWPYQRPWDCAGMGHRGYILTIEENDLSVDVKRDRDVERVKQDLGGHNWPCIQLCQVKFKTFKSFNR